MKRITEQEKVQQIFLAASLEDAQRYMAVAGAILMARFPQSAKVKVTNHRKPRKATTQDAWIANAGEAMKSS